MQGQSIWERRASNTRQSGAVFDLVNEQELLSGLTAESSDLGPLVKTARAAQSINWSSWESLPGISRKISQNCQGGQQAYSSHQAHQPGHMFPLRCQRMCESQNPRFLPEWVVQKVSSQEPPSLGLMLPWAQPGTVFLTHLRNGYTVRTKRFTVGDSSLYIKHTRFLLPKWLCSYQPPGWNAFAQILHGWLLLPQVSALNHISMLNSVRAPVDLPK